MGAHACSGTHEKIVAQIQKLLMSCNSKHANVNIKSSAKWCEMMWSDVKTPLASFISAYPRYVYVTMVAAGKVASIAFKQGTHQSGAPL